MAPDKVQSFIDGVKQRYREYKLRFGLAKHALRGSDFVREATPGHDLFSGYNHTELPRWADTPESESRSALLGRASEPETRYAALRDMREAYEHGDDLQRVVGEMARMQNYDRDVIEALRLMEDKYRKQAVKQIEQRIEIERKQWDDSGLDSAIKIIDPRLQYRQIVRINAREIANHDGDGLPPSAEYAVENSPREVLAFMADSEEIANKSPTTLN